jgi:hypothetical protein
MSRNNSTRPSDSDLCELVADAATSLAYLFDRVLDRLEVQERRSSKPPRRRDSRKLPSNVIPFRPRDPEPVA